MSDAVDHRGQDSDEEQAGQRVCGHVHREARSWAAIGHETSLPTGAYIQTKEVFCVAYLLLIFVLAGLAYVGYRLTRVSAGRPKTRVIGPDDDPDFLRRLGNGNNRSEEHTSELQSLRHLVCRLLLEKKK